MKSSSSRLLAVVCVAAVLGGGVYYMYCYPYGLRPAYLPSMLAALRDYAGANGGAFPAGDNGPLEALRKLYPAYMPNSHLLAGLSGDRKLINMVLKSGERLPEAASSWVYWPGLTLDDDENIAIIWESRSGLLFNGKRSYGHAVGYIRGNLYQVPDSEWPAFLTRQDGLRRAVARHRDQRPLEAPAGRGQADNH